MSLWLLPPIKCRNNYLILLKLTHSNINLHAENRHGKFSMRRWRKVFHFNKFDFGKHCCAASFQLHKKIALGLAWSYSCSGPNIESFFIHSIPIAYYYYFFFIFLVVDRGVRPCIDLIFGPLHDTNSVLAFFNVNEKRLDPNGNLFCWPQE